MGHLVTEVEFTDSLPSINSILDTVTNYAGHYITILWDESGNEGYPNLFFSMEIDGFPLTHVIISSRFKTIIEVESGVPLDLYFAVIFSLEKLGGVRKSKVPNKPPEEFSKRILSTYSSPIDLERLRERHRRAERGLKIEKYWYLGPVIFYSVIGLAAWLISSKALPFIKNLIN